MKKPSRLVFLIFVAIAVSVAGCSKHGDESKAEVRIIKSQDTPVDELMEKSGLNAQIVKLPEKVLSDADDQLRKGISAVDAVRSIIINTFNPSELRTIARDHLQENLNQEQVTSILAWLNSDIGKKVSALEVAGTKGNTHQQVMSNYRELKKDEARLNLVKQLDKAASVTENSVDMELAVQRSLLVALMPSMPEKRVISEADIAERIKQVRPSMVKKYQVMTEASVLHNFQSLSDGEMQAYVAFAESDVAKHYHQVLAQSLEKAVAAAGGKAGIKIETLGES